MVCHVPGHIPGILVFAASHGSNTSGKHHDVEAIELSSSASAALDGEARRFVKLCPSKAIELSIGTSAAFNEETRRFCERACWQR